MLNNNYFFFRDNLVKTESLDHQVNRDPVEVPEVKVWLALREIKGPKDELETQDSKGHQETKEKMVLMEIKDQLVFKDDKVTPEN